MRAHVQPVALDRSNGLVDVAGCAANREEGKIGDFVEMRWRPEEMAPMNVCRLCSPAGVSLRIPSVLAKIMFFMSLEARH